MKVDYDRLRKNLIQNFNDIITCFNDEIELQESMTPDIDMEELSKDIRALRQDIAFIACLELEGIFESIKDFELKTLHQEIPASAEEAQTTQP